MARTIIIADDSYQHADADYSDAHNYRKGYIVQSFEDGADTGTKVTLPRFCIIETPGVPLSTVKQYEQDFTRQIQFTIFASDLALDGYRVDVATINKTLGGRGRITRAKVESFLNDWGGTVVNVNADRVRFDITVYGFVTSPNVLGSYPVSFTEQSYDQGTGVHRIEATYNNAPVNQDAMTKAEQIVDRVGTVISSTPGSIVFDVVRDEIFAIFKESIRERLEDRFLTRRYYIDPLIVDQAIANGGALTMTGPEALAAIKDLAAE